MALERHYISQDYSLDSTAPLIVHNSGLMVAVVNEIDHLRLSAFRPGFDLRSAHSQLDALDSRLENSLHYAVSAGMGTRMAQSASGVQNQVKGDAVQVGHCRHWSGGWHCGGGYGGGGYHSRHWSHRRHGSGNN